MIRRYRYEKLAQEMASAGSLELEAAFRNVRARQVTDVSLAAKARILDSNKMLDGNQVQRLCQLNIRQLANFISGSALILFDLGETGGNYNGVRDAFPAFQFNENARCLHTHVVTINKLLAAGNDPWGVASWWLSPNGRLENKVTPASLLGTSEGDEVLVKLAEFTVYGPDCSWP